MSLLVHGQEGRLFQALRIENNLVYGVNGLTQSLNKVGFVAVSTAVETKDTLQAINLIIKEINKIKISCEICNCQISNYAFNKHCKTIKH